MKGDKVYEVHYREKRKRGRAPLELDSVFKASHWQFAMKRAARLRAKHAEVVLREVTVTSETITRAPKKNPETGVVA